MGPYSYSRLQEVGTWKSDDSCWDSFLLWFGAGGQSCSTSWLLLYYLRLVALTTTPVPEFGPGSSSIRYRYMTLWDLHNSPTSATCHLILQTPMVNPDPSAHESRAITCEERGYLTEALNCIYLVNYDLKLPPCTSCRAP